MTEKKRIFLASPHMSDEGYEMEYIKEAFDTNWIAPLGENVNKFEEEMCDKIGSKAALALSSGTAAMPVSYTHLDVYKRQGFRSHVFTGIFRPCSSVTSNTRSCGCKCRYICRI